MKKIMLMVFMGLAVPMVHAKDPETPRSDVKAHVLMAVGTVASLGVGYIIKKKVCRSIWGDFESQDYQFPQQPSQKTRASKLPAMIGTSFFSVPFIALSYWFSYKKTITWHMKQSLKALEKVENELLANIILNEQNQGEILGKAGCLHGTVVSKGPNKDTIIPELCAIQALSTLFEHAQKGVTHCEIALRGIEAELMKGIDNPETRAVLEANRMLLYTQLSKLTHILSIIIRNLSYFKVERKDQYQKDLALTQRFEKESKSMWHTLARPFVYVAKSAGAMATIVGLRQILRTLTKGGKDAVLEHDDIPHFSANLQYDC